MEHWDIQIKTKKFNLKNTLECGQCFRWKKIDNNEYIGVIVDRVLKVKQEGKYLYISSNKTENLKEVVSEYFDLYEDYENIEKDISKKDKNILIAVKNTSGLHFVNQDLFETIISYIISSNNNIKRISKSVNKISEICGKKVEFEEENYYLFPTAKEISKLSIKDLQSAGTGYRAMYIYSTIRNILNEKHVLEILKQMPTKEARTKLESYMGIGRKVADCILLFSLKRREVFPVDIWIKRIIRTLYFDSEPSMKEILDFADKKFGKHAGIIQQHLYMNIRENII